MIQIIFELNCISKKKKTKQNKKKFEVNLLLDLINSSKWIFDFWFTNRLVITRFINRFRWTRRKIPEKERNQIMKKKKKTQQINKKEIRPLKNTHT